jgi:hypothetical protein
MNTIVEKNTPQYIESEIKKILESLKDRIFQITEDNFLNPNCIDGRDSDVARPSIPWGWLGALGVILAYFDSIKLDIDKSLIVQYVKEFFWGTLSWHSDDHEWHSHNCGGCGHAERLIKQWDRYDLSQESSQFLQTESNLIQSPDILSWNHNERAVIIVDVQWYWIKANHENTQDFIYNKAYAEKLYNKLTIYLQEKLKVEIEQEKLLQIAEKHFLTTWWDLAQDKNVYKLSDYQEGGEVWLEHLMYIPKKQAA